jgi:membrane protein required for colicin V production
MTGFDIAVIGLVLLSTLLAFWRGLIRVAVSLATWVVALIAAVKLSPQLGPMLPFVEQPTARYLAAFLLILIGVLIVGALIGLILSRAARAVGLGFLDRLLGAVFGLARGLLMVMLIVLICGVTTLPRNDWWQNAVLAQPLAVAALSLRPWLPKPWADRLDYGRAPRERPSVRERTHPDPATLQRVRTNRVASGEPRERGN